jgi:hypothetical protein
VTWSSRATLPPVPNDTVRHLQIAQDQGRLHLADVDEAELLAAGAPPQSRPGIPNWAGTPAEIDAAGRRLVERGLADPQPWAQGEVTPARDLLVYASLAFDPRTRAGSVSSWLDPEPPASLRTQQQICSLIDVVHGGIACVASMSIPIPAQAGPLPVSLDVVRLDVLVAGIATAAFAELPEGVDRGVGVVFLDGRRNPVITRLAVSASGAGELTSPRSARIGPRTKTERVGRSEFADHLRLRLTAAGA